MPIESVMPSSHLILCHPLLILPSIFPSIRVFSNESILCMRWPKYWSFSFSISPSNEHPGLISFMMDWLDLLAVQGTLKSLLQHHSSMQSVYPDKVPCTIKTFHSILSFQYDYYLSSSSDKLHKKFSILTVSSSSSSSHASSPGHLHDFFCMNL